MPDVLGRDRAAYAGRHTVVVGAGYSAANVLLDLAQLAGQDAGTAITWVVRGTSLVRVYGGGLADELPARGALGWRLKELVDRGAIDLVLGFAATAVEAVDGRIGLAGETAEGPRRIGPADRIVVATGQRPDLTMTRELRLELDPWLESVKALGPLIDPNLHSCGSVAPHGYRELAHPEPGFYTIGVKSYGRAPTFLLLTGYEQARSVAAAIAGDLDGRRKRAAGPAGDRRMPGARRDSGRFRHGCCGGPPPVGQAGCCVADVAAKAAGQAGCGCGPGGVMAVAAAPAASGEPNRVVVITALGLTQILAWGSSYYLLAVLAPVDRGRYRMAPALDRRRPVPGSDGGRVRLATGRPHDRRSAAADRFWRRARCCSPRDCAAWPSRRPCRSIWPPGSSSASPWARASTTPPSRPWAGFTARARGRRSRR